MNTVILTGPQGCGKSTHSELLRRSFGCVGVVDEWEPGMKIEPGRLHLTNVPVAAAWPDVLLVQFSDARVHAAIFSARQ